VRELASARRAWVHVLKGEFCREWPWKCLEVSGSVCEIVSELEIFARVFGCEFLFALVIEWVFLSDCGIVLPDSWTSLFGRGGGCNEHA
jgi:hypothetical protein